MLALGDEEAHGKVSFRKPIDAIAVSGHKFIGCPMPCGICIIRRHLLEPMRHEVRVADGTRCDWAVPGSGIWEACLACTVLDCLDVLPCTFPCARLTYPHVPHPSQIPYLSSIDDTLTGSRNGMLAVYLWYLLSYRGIEASARAECLCRRGGSGC